MELVAWAQKYPQDLPLGISTHISPTERPPMELIYQS